MESNFQGERKEMRLSSSHSHQKQQSSQGYPAKDESQPSVQVQSSQQNPPKMDYHQPSSQASDQAKQLQPLNGAPSHQSSNLQPQSQQELPSVGVLPLPQNPPKSNHHPPSFQEPSNGIPLQGYSTKDDQLLSNQSTNQPPSNQNPGKNDHHPPSNQTSEHPQPRQPLNEVPSGTYPSNDHLQSNQPRKKQPPTQEKHPVKEKHAPTDSKSSNQSQQPEPQALPPPPKNSFLGPSTAQGNLPKKPTPTFQPADPPLQPQNGAGIDAQGKVRGDKEPVLAFPDPSYLPESYLNQLPLYAPPPSPPPPPRASKCCCSVL